MRTIIAAVAIVAAITTSARADSVTTNCQRFGHSTSCTTTTRALVPARPITYTALEIAQIKMREDEWNTYCKPRDVVGDDGLLRAVYAHKNCDIGAYKPNGSAE